jgi:hypothetical protein
MFYVLLPTPTCETKTNQKEWHWQPNIYIFTKPNKILEKRDCRIDPAFAKLQHPAGNAAQDQEGGDHKKKLNYKIEINTR